MTTAFGPQGSNASSIRGTVQQRYSSDTWVRDCTGTGKDDGTVLNAQFFNCIIGNLREAVRAAGVPLDDDDMTMLTKAISALATRQSTTFDILRLTPKSIGELPAANASYANVIIMCSDAAGVGQPRLVYCNGANWLRVDTNAVVA